MNGATSNPPVDPGGIDSIAVVICASPMSIIGRKCSTRRFTSRRATRTPDGRPVAIAAEPGPGFVSAPAQTVAAIGQDIDRGALDLTPAIRRRQAVRRLVDAAGPRPNVSVIGCAEHRALAEEVARRSAVDA